MSYTNMSTVSLFSDMHNIGNIKLTTELYGSNFLNDEFEKYSQFCGPCIVSTENQNLYGPHKELLL